MPGPLIQDNTPWWADPKGASVMDPLYITLARKAAGLMGAGDPATQAMGMAGGPLEDIAQAPSGLIQSLLKMPKTQAPEATSQLLNMLNGFKTNPITKAEAAQMFSAEAPGSAMVSPRVGYRSLYNAMKRRIPEVEDTLKPGTMVEDPKLARPSGFNQLENMSGRIRAAANPAETNKLALATVLRDRLPRVTTTDDLGLVAKTGTGIPVDAPKPALSGGLQGGQSAGARARVLAKSGLTEDQIRSLRGADLKNSLEQYPHVKVDAMRNIIKGDSYPWIR